MKLHLKRAKMVLITMALCALTASAQPIFLDDFNGSSLDLSQWRLVDGSVQVAGGQLRTVGNPDHKRIDSNLAFGTNDVTATASINLNGRYQRFGFKLNPSDFGYYFDTLGETASGGDESVRDKVYVIAYSGSTLRLRLLVPATWGQFHDFSIRRTLSNTTFFIDGQQVAQITDVATQLLRVGVENDRPEVMLTDWVEVRQSSARIVRVVPTSGASGGTINIPIELVAVGDENALGFSLTYDPTLLSNPQAALGSGASTASINPNASQTGQGRFGVAMALPAGQTFVAGEKQIVLMTFLVASGLTTRTTTIGFGDQPIRREVVNTSANSLPTFYTYGTITISPGYEADVSPRPNGNNNGTVTIADWVQTGRFAAGVDAAAGSEFQRADCAPKETKGDGRMSIADWVQAGRYAAGIDTVVAALTVDGIAANLVTIAVR